MTRFLRPAILFAALAMCLPACTPKKAAGDIVPARLADNGMEELKQVYEYIRDQKEPVPRKVEDLDKYEASLPTAYGKIKDGNYVMTWGAGLTGGSGVLAYEKEAAASGGLVLQQDGTIKKVTADEFKKVAPAR